MQAILADFDPGALTCMVIIVVFGIVFVASWIGAGIALLFKNQKAARGFLIACGFCFAIGFVLVFLVSCFAKRLGLL